MDQKCCLDLTRMCTQQSTLAKEIWAASNTDSRSSMEKRLMKCRPCTCKGYRHLSHPRASTRGSWLWWAIRHSTEGSTLFSFSFSLPKVCGAVPSRGIGPTHSNRGVSAGDFGHRWQKSLREGGRKEGKENWSNFNSRKPLLDSRKCSMKLMVPAVWALPKAAGSITTFSGFCLWSCTKRTFPYVHRIPFLIPHLLQQLFQEWSPWRSMGHMCAGCSNTPEAAVERRLIALLGLAFLAKPLFYPLPAHTKPHPSTGSRAWYTRALGHVLIHPRMLHHCLCQEIAFN